MAATPGDAESAIASQLDPTLRSLVEASPVAMLALDRSGRLIAANDAAERLLGWSDEHVGRPLAGVPSDLLAHLADDRLASGGRRAEERWTRLDGREVALEATSSPLFDVSGRPAGCVVQLVEIGHPDGLERVAKELQRLSIVLFRPISRREVIDAVAREACRLVGAQSARVRMSEHDPRPLPAAADGGSDLIAVPSDAIPGAHEVEWRSSTSIVVPVVVDGSRIGGLELHFARPAVLDDHDRLALSTLAALTGRALERARLDEEADRIRHEAVRAEEQASSLVALTADLSAALTPEEVARAAMERGLPAVGATSGSIVLLDPSGGDLIVVAMQGYSEEVNRTFRTLSIDADFPLAEAVRNRKAVFLESPDVWSRRYPLLEDALRGSDVQALATIPLEVHGRVIGGLRLGFPTVRTFDPADAAYMHALADKCAQAIERSRLFEAERHARLTLDTVISQMPIGVVVAEPPLGRIVLANAQVSRIWRAPEGQEILDFGSWVGYRLDGARIAADDWPLARSLAHGDTVDGEEIEIVRGDATKATLLVSSAPVRDATGAIVAAVATLADISDRREADLMREAFLGVLSHELRTPITAIYGGIQLLRRPPERVDDATRREVVGDVAAEAERLIRLVEDLLVLARAERGVPLSAADPVLLTHLLPRVVAAEQARWSQTNFDVRLPSRVPTIRGDESYVEQVVRNLLSNAAKYGPLDGRVEVTVSVDDDHDEVIVRVADEGPGIDEAEASELFRLFYRSPRTASATGAGIGLFVARSLVEAMGGRIWAIPRSDRRGAEFGIAFRVFEDVDEV